MRVAARPLAPMAALLLSTLLAPMAGSARAEVVERVRQESYVARHAAGQSLLEALNAASPIRQDGRTFHGHTRWHIRWNFRWRQQPDGVCEMTSIATELNVTITLPRLRTDDANAAAEFDTFVRALAAHEDGHRALAQETAATVDRTLASLRGAGPCADFTARANAIADELVRAAKQRERQFDIDTNHGCKQGACLPARRGGPPRNGERQ